MSFSCSLPRALLRTTFAALAAAGLSASLFAGVTDRDAPVPADESAPPRAEESGFGTGTWAVNDGGNTYLEMSKHAGPLTVQNKGPGRVSVILIDNQGRSRSIHLPPGGNLRMHIPQGIHVEVWDGGKDGLGASGTYAIP